MEKENIVPSVLLIVEKEITLFVLIPLHASTKKTVTCPVLFCAATMSVSGPVEGNVGWEGYFKYV